METSQCIFGIGLILLIAGAYFRKDGPWYGKYKYKSKKEENISSVIFFVGLILLIVGVIGL